jgi:hypothetical protein
MDMVLPIAISLLTLFGVVAAIAGYESRDGYRPE